MLDHYIELIRHFWRTILLGALVAGGLSLAMSLVLLRAMPLYEASVVMNMQPSEEELRFNRGFLGVSQFNPATIIAQTHIERLLSRQVAGRAIDILTEGSGGALAPAPRTFLREVKSALWRWYNILNFGYFEPQPERQTAISDLIGATEVEIVEGSYILQVSVSLDDPDLAARAANALARAYIEETRDEFQADAARVDASLDREIAAREADLAARQAERQQTARDFGVANIDRERAIMLDTRAAARASLEDIEVELALLDTTLASLRGSIAGASDAETVRGLRQTLASTEASRAAIEERLRLGGESLARTDAALRDLDTAQDALAEIDQRIAAVAADLLELRNRRVGARVAREAELSQVRTIQSASPPVYPKSPKVLVNTIVGTILGGILVLVPVIAMDVLGDRIRTSEDLRGSLGARVLPPITRRLLRHARRYNDGGGTPSRLLRRYADAVGRRFVSDGAHRWPSGELFVTAFGSPAEIAALREVMTAVLRIAAPRAQDGAAPEVVDLPPVSRIADWSAQADRHVVIGLRPGTVDRDELGVMGDDAGAVPPGAPVSYAALLP
ncbi:GumC family protein [Jannaschia rubra]|uniref:GumC family protein n=1 Tax=Jannaschia rubra TaxID=282197 RepID=UPI002492F18B|nr:hypothetical protein [Jannaschia rubra]